MHNEIVSILDKDIKCICVRDAIDTLEVPHVMTLEIAHEHEYQIDLYFHIVIEPNIAYTYPNQYYILFMFVKYIIHRFISFIVTNVYLILLKYVKLSTCLLLYCTLSKNIYSTKVYTCKSKWFICDSGIEKIFYYKWCICVHIYLLFIIYISQISQMLITSQVCLIVT